MELKNQTTIVVLFDCKNGSPNTNPDDNMPRMHDDGTGFTTEGCLKHKIRQDILNRREEHMTPDTDPDMPNPDNLGYDCYTKPGSVLNAETKEVAAALKLVKPDVSESELKKRLGKLTHDEDLALHDELCRRYFDIRAFGATVTVAANAKISSGIKGPVQMAFPTTFDSISPEFISMTRCCVTKEDKAATGARGTFGNKTIIPYGLYRGLIHVNKLEARRTGFSQEDLELLIESLKTMFENDASSTRGLMTTRLIMVVEHAKTIGSIPRDLILESVTAKLKPGIDAPMSFNDYEINIDKDALTKAAKVTVWTPKDGDKVLIDEN